ncbi:ribosomal maturation YjgA family protein [Bacillus swezeyi]|uniref:DUF2809 domain-containing protein n=1 Tax=Bacillus swezeyi TaxID=1925020 RepID=A0A5M8RQX7_9BACI|nr:DUF2809 domain-containing protein [Bacillus swezeyi]KAA6449406.1 DUF2809 domain-containing protein [Bacillus swezeyi]TYS33423.1 DUF2809 domain-containing protein [Bacillus swezeyi]
MTKKRSRIWQASLTLAAMAAGLLSRKMSGMPDIVNSYAGDALWALMIFFGFGFLFNRAATKTVALAALSFCYLIEFSQLYHAPWIDHLRAAPLGGLILGYGFLWSDLLAYLLGTGAAAMFERMMHTRKRQP